MAYMSQKVSDVYSLQVTSGYCVRQHRYGTFPSLQKAFFESTANISKINTNHQHLIMLK
jgi:hypothetical protein